MMTDLVDVRWCSTCADELLFEQPVCADGHGADCPEWVCVQCGDALLLGFLELGGPRSSRPQGSSGRAAAGQVA